MFLDPSLGLLWLCAITCIWYGSSRSYEFFNEVKDTAPQEIKFVQSKKILALPIIGSVVLLLLFFLLDFSITIYILIVLIAIVVFVSQFFVFSPLADYIFSKLFKEPKGFTLPKLGYIPASAVALFLYSSGVVTLWICTKHWTIVDAIAWCLAITQMCVLRLPSLKIATLLLVPFLIYDVFWVFISPLFFKGESVMVSVAMRLPPFPLLLKIPHFTNTNDFSGLGLGDIALPGLLVVFLYSFDEHIGKSDKIQFSNLKTSYLSYFTLSLIEYTLGYIVTLMGGYLMESGQPALLYLVPFTLGFTAFFAWRRGDLALMWQGHHIIQKEDVEAQSLLEEDKQDESVAVNLGPLDLREVVTAASIHGESTLAHGESTLAHGESTLAHGESTLN